MPARLPLLRLPIFVILLVLAGALLAAGTAHAASTSTAQTALTATFESLSEEEEEEEGEEAEEETECETAEEEVEEGELTQGEADEICKEEARENKKNASNPGSAPEECILRSAHAQASLVSHDKKLKLTIGYTTYEPVAAKLEIGHLATIHRHLGHSGVIREVENLHGDNPPKQLAVQIKLASARSAGCPFRRLVLFPR